MFASDQRPVSRELQQQETLDCAAVWGVFLVPMSVLGTSGERHSTLGSVDLFLWSREKVSIKTETRSSSHHVILKMFQRSSKKLFLPLKLMKGPQWPLQRSSGYQDPVLRPKLNLSRVLLFNVAPPAQSSHWLLSISVGLIGPDHPDSGLHTRVSSSSETHWRSKASVLHTPHDWTHSSILTVQI